MDKKIVWSVSLLLMVSLVLTAIPAIGSPLPHERYGQAYIDDDPAEEGYTVSSWINGTRYESSEVFTENGSYQITTHADDPTDETVKSGGVDGETIVYRIEDNEGNISIADENSIFEYGNIEEGDLNFQTEEQPSTEVKINELVPQPGDGKSQYIYLYDPINITRSDWRIDTHDGFSRRLDNLPSTYHPEHPEILFVDLQETDILGEDGGHLMLSWDPGTSGINEDEWVVMDRVEYGDITSPENTIHPEHPGAPDQEEALVREPWGNDTDSSEEDFIIENETGRIEVPADHIRITPEESIVSSGESQEYFSTAYDAFDNELRDVTEETTWSIDEDAGGDWEDNVYTSEHAGDWEVTGSYLYEGNDLIDTADLTVEPVYDLTIDIEGEGEVEVDPEEEEYEEGTEVTLTAIPEEGWYFEEWTGDYEGTREEIEITMDEDKEITAHFEEYVYYELDVNINGEGEVEVDPEEEEYEEGTEVTLTAIPEEGWYFEEWTGDHEGPEEEIVITMDEDKEITAHFEEDVEYYSLTIEKEGEGEVEVDPDEEEYEEGTKVDITAVPEEGWYFVEWTGDHEDESREITIVMDSEKTLTANFDEIKEDEYVLTIGVEGEGTTDPEPGDHIYEEDEEVTVEATADEGWYFVGWTGDHEGVEEEITLTMDEDKEITAVFEEIESYDLTVDIEGEGLVEIDPDEEEYEEGTEVTLTAIPEEGWYFVGWTGDHEDGDREIKITMDEDKTLTANFAEVGEDEYVLTIGVEGEGTTDPKPGDHLYEEDEEVSVQAIPVEGWYFEEWIGVPEGTEEEITITMDEDKEITAVFEEDVDMYDLTVEIKGQGTVDREPDQEEYEEGTDVTLTADPEEGWYFEEWTGDHEGVEEEIEITIDDDKVITAVFEEEVELEPYFAVEIIEFDDEVEEGEKITVNFTVTNTGDEQGTQEIAIYVNGEKVVSYGEITLAPDEEYQGEITFDAENIGEGLHELEVRSDDEASESVNVDVMAEEDEGFVANYWWLIVLVLIVIIALVVLMFVMQGEEEEEEEGEMEEDIFEESDTPAAGEEPSFDQGLQEDKSTTSPPPPEEEPFEEETDDRSEEIWDDTEEM